MLEQTDFRNETAAAVFGAFGRQYVRKSRCRALSTRRESWVRAREGWRQPSVRSGVESRRPSRVARDGAGSPSTAEPRTCETVRAASGRPCRRGRKPGERATRSTAGTSPPRIVGRRKSMRVAPVFAGRQRAERGERRSPSRRRHDRSMESHETKQGKDEDRHEPRFLVFPALKVKSLPADRSLASHRKSRPTVYPIIGALR